MSAGDTVGCCTQLLKQALAVYHSLGVGANWFLILDLQQPAGAIPRHRIRRDHARSREPHSSWIDDWSDCPSRPTMSDEPIPLFGLDDLLVIACSKRKRTDPGLLPAIERYDGPTFRLLRRFLTQHSDMSSRIHVLSAEFGIIPCSHPIPIYDRRMTRARARELQPTVTKGLQDALIPGRHYDIFVSAGRDYMLALSGCNAILRSADSAHLAGGSAGRRLSQLHDWLYGHPPATPLARRDQQPSDRPLIRGVEVPFTADQVLDLARRSIDDEGSPAQNYQSWYVAVDNQRIAPKWLVSQACGLPVSRFTTDDARRLLARLGIPVFRA